MTKFRERMLPRAFPDLPEFIIPLSQPELLELGIFTAIWSQIDWIIMLMISHLTDTHLKHLHLMMDGMTTSPRVNLLKKICQENPNEITSHIQKICEENGGLIEDRNHIIHGLWSVHYDQKTKTTTAACLYQKGKRKPLPATKLKTLSDRASKLSCQLGKQLDQLSPNDSGGTPRVFYFSDGSPPSGELPPWPPKLPPQSV